MCSRLLHSFQAAAIDSLGRTLAHIDKSSKIILHNQLKEQNIKSSKTTCHKKRSKQTGLYENETNGGLEELFKEESTGGG